MPGTETIIIYSKATYLPLYTVEPPYADETLTFYENLVASDSTIGLALSVSSDIIDKYIEEAFGDPTLTARALIPDLATFEGEVEDSPGVYLHRLVINNIFGATVIIDGDSFELGIEGSADIRFKTK
jgi:hypothetical protein